MYVERAGHILGKRGNHLTSLWVGYIINTQGIEFSAPPLWDAARGYTPEKGGNYVAYVLGESVGAPWGRPIHTSDGTGRPLYLY